MADYRDKILALVKIHPVQPTFVAKVLNTDSMLASAMLGEMASKGALKISYLKIGSSPLYYLPDSGHQLQQYTHALNEKDRQAYELLKQKTVLRDVELEPLTRVSMRTLKDFALPLEVNFNNSKEIFWKWYLTQDEQAVQTIRNLLMPENIVQEKFSDQEKTLEQKKEVQQQLHNKLEKKQEIKPEIKQEIKSESLSQKFKSPEKVQRPSEIKTSETKLNEPIKQPQQIKNEIVQKIEEPKKVKKAPKEDKFIDKVKEYFSQNQINILEENSLRKGESDFIIEFQSALGNITFYCKAKSKKNITDSDLSNSYVQGQLKKLPTLLLSEGELNKKALEMSKELKGVTFKRLE